MRRASLYKSNDYCEKGSDRQGGNGVSIKLFRCDQDLGDFPQFLLTRISLWLYTQFMNMSVEEQKRG